MATSSKESFQIHNYSFAAIEAFIQEVRKYPMVYQEHTHDKSVVSFWPEIVKALLENGADYVLTPSERLYWERIYRGLWMWMRHILTIDLVGRYLGLAALSQNPKYIWLEYLKFLEPFIQLSANSFNYDPDLDPFIYLQVLSTEEVALVPYYQYMVYWKKFHEDLVGETFYISICVHTMDFIPFDNLKLELEVFLETLNNIEEDAEIKIPAEKLITFSPSGGSTTPDENISDEITNIIGSTTPDENISDEITNIIEEELMSFLSEDAEFNEY